VALGDQFLHPRPPDADQPEFGGDEEGVHQDEKDDAQ
jgi:hypothetical protein